LKSILLAASALLLALLCACGPKQGARPVSTSPGRAERPSAPKPAAISQLSIFEKRGATDEAAVSTPEAIVAPSPAVTGEAEISTVESARGNVAGSGSTEPGCFFTLCLGMGYEEVERVAPALGKDPGIECEPGRMRPLPLPVPAEGVKRYVCYQRCGGPLDHATFYFHRGELAGFHIYFEPDGFKDRSLGEVLGDAEKGLGPPDSEAWEEPGERGKVAWNRGDVKITLEVISARPFALRVVNTEKIKTK